MENQKKTYKKRISTFLAILLCLTIFLSLAPLAAIFTRNTGDTYEVLSFEQPTDHRVVPFGTELEQLNLPSALRATVRLANGEQDANLLSMVDSLFSPLTALAAEVAPYGYESEGAYDIVVNEPSEPVDDYTQPDNNEENVNDNSAENNNEHAYENNNESNNENINEGENINENESKPENESESYYKSEQPPDYGENYETTTEPQTFTTYVPVTWQSFPHINPGQALMVGTYTFTAELGAGYELAHGAVPLPTITVEVEPIQISAMNAWDDFGNIERQLYVERDGVLTPVGQGSELYLADRLYLEVEIELDAFDSYGLLDGPHRSFAIWERIRDGDPTSFSFPLPLSGLRLNLGGTLTWNINEQPTNLKIASVSYANDNLTITFEGAFWNQFDEMGSEFVPYINFELRFELDRDPNAPDDSHLIELTGDDYFTVTIIGEGGDTYPSELDKNALNHIPGTGLGSFEWELIYSPADRHAFPVVITDVFGGGVSLPHALTDPTDIRIERWDEATNAWVDIPNMPAVIASSVTYAQYRAGFTLTISSESPLAGEDIRISYTSVICDERIADWLENNPRTDDLRVSNSATLIEGVSPIGDPVRDDHIISDYGPTWIEKNGVRLVGALRDYIQWTVIIHDLHDFLGDLVLHDALGSGLELDSNSIVINGEAHPWSAFSPNIPTLDENPAGRANFTISFGDQPFLGSSAVREIVITYRTRIVGNADSFTNDAWITYTWPSGTSTPILVRPPGVVVIPRDRPIIIEKSFVDYQLRPAEIANPQRPTVNPPHTITWRIDLNPHGLRVDSGDIIETLPAFNRFLGIRRDSPAVDDDFIVLGDWTYVPFDDPSVTNNRGHVTIPLHSLGSNTTHFYIYTQVDNPRLTHNSWNATHVNEARFDGFVYSTRFSQDADAYVTRGQSMGWKEHSAEGVRHIGDGVFEFSWRLLINEPRLQTYFLDDFYVVDILPEHHTFVEDSERIVEVRDHNWIHNWDSATWGEIDVEELCSTVNSGDSRIVSLSNWVLSPSGGARPLPPNNQVLIFTHTDQGAAGPPFDHSRGPHFSGRAFSVEYRTRVNVLEHDSLRDLFLSNDQLSFTNRMFFSPIPGSYSWPNNSTRPINPTPLLDKSAEVTNEVDVLYTVNINPYAIGLVGVGKGLTLVDYLDSYLILDMESITLYNATVNAQGVFTRDAAVDPQPPITFVDRSDGEDGMAFTLDLPGNGPFILEYEATILPGATGRLENSIRFTGAGGGASEDTAYIDADAFQGGGGAVSLTRSALRLSKVDADDNTTFLQDATFRVYAVLGDGQLRHIQTRTTNIEGVATFAGLRPTGTYRFVEYEAATGFLEDTVGILEQSPNITAYLVYGYPDTFDIRLDNAADPQLVGLITISNLAEEIDNGGGNGEPPGGNGEPPPGGNGEPPPGGNGEPPPGGGNGNGEGNGGGEGNGNGGGEGNGNGGGEGNGNGETPPPVAATRGETTPRNESPLPRTGDDNFPGWWIIMLISGLAVLSMLIWQRFKKKKQQTHSQMNSTLLTATAESLPQLEPLPSAEPLTTVETPAAEENPTTVEKPPTAENPTMVVTTALAEAAVHRVTHHRATRNRMAAHRVAHRRTTNNRAIRRRKKHRRVKHQY